MLNRVASLFRRRMFNIESLTVGHTDQPGMSRMTIVVDGATTDVEQVIKQLYKLIEVVKVSEITHDPAVAHELALIKVSTSAGHRPEVLQLAERLQRHRGRRGAGLGADRGDRARRPDRLAGAGAARLRHQGDGAHRRGRNDEGLRASQPVS